MKRGKTDFDAIIPNHASTWRRAFAFLIDILIIYIAVSPLSGLLSKQLGLQDSLNFNALKEIVSKPEMFAEASTMVVIVGILISIMGLLYWTALEYMLKQSVGKMLMKIEIRSTTKELKLWQVLLRNVTKAMSITSLSVVFIIDVAYMFFNPNRQRLTEVLSKTEVVHASE